MLIEWPFYAKIEIIADQVPNHPYEARMAYIAEMAKRNLMFLKAKG